MLQIQIRLNFTKNNDYGPHSFIGFTEFSFIDCHIYYRHPISETPFAYSNIGIFQP